MGYWTLLEKGKTLLVDSGGKDYIDSNLEELFKEIKRTYVENAYDRQDQPRMGDAARIVMALQIKKSKFNKIRQFAIENDMMLDEFLPDERKLAVLLDILGIYLSELIEPVLDHHYNELKIEEEIMTEEEFTQSNEEWDKRLNEMVRKIE
jgi:hypothetical protein